MPDHVAPRSRWNWTAFAVGMAVGMGVGAPLGIVGFIMALQVVAAMISLP